MSPQVEHTDVGAYALGLLEEPDRRAFAAHLAGCPSCTAELAELSGMAAMLDGVEPVGDDRDTRADAVPATVIDMVRRERIADRRTRRGTLVMAAAAAVALVSGGIVAGAAIGGDRVTAPITHPGHDSEQGPAEEFYHRGTPVAGRGAPGVSGGLVLETKEWGTHAAMELKGIKGPLECELIAVSGTGERKVIAGWSVPDKGYGVPTYPEPLYIHGGTALPAADIDRFEVIANDGRTLITFEV
ncbi:anti-sigma factor family protein [Planobispora siamensis]|uniref:RNA polymerase subunit sigma n=1 Tax=Planobispora siamensis TaxID=936338 RepID=A0A8J3SF01_9ACTN|nr:zf-HC2 domain-containing protein [Planobispora siamensis]GIH93127.1 RNA polymerase subunit sigma [Planobispora siamensis]